ncbi:MAG: hypothetical protein AB7I36_04880 [Rhodospirillaceae bacterium]
MTGEISAWSYGCSDGGESGPEVSKTIFEDNEGACQGAGEGGCKARREARCEVCARKVRTRKTGGQDGCPSKSAGKRRDGQDRRDG